MSFSVPVYQSKTVLIYLSAIDPHLIWMDIRMPVMNGLEAARIIRKSKQGDDPKIVAVTAHALEQEREEIMAAGCDGFIRKPYKAADVYDMLVSQLGGG